MYLKYSFILIISVSFSFLQAADQEEPLSKQWVALAHDLALDKIGYFHWLPLEIQANIFSRINPEPTLDDWYSNKLMCVKNFTAPHKIVSFDIKGDRLAYMGEKNKDFLSYKPYWIDLKTNDHNSPCAQSADVEHAGKEVPRVEWASTDILFETYTYDDNSLPEKNLLAINIFGELIGNYKVATVTFLTAEDKWKAHAFHSYVVVTAKNQLTSTHVLNFLSINKERGVVRRESPVCPSVCISKWHPYLLQLYNYYSGDTGTSISLLNPWNKNYSQLKIPTTHGDFNFSPDGNTFCIKHGLGLLQYNTTYNEKKVLTLPENKKRFLLRGVGNFTYLAEESNSEGNGTGAYSLRSLNDGSGVDVSLTELSNLPPLHKLPSGDDYRLVTIVSDEESATSTIKIMVPQLPELPILFQHYCMLNAVLEAGKEKNNTAYDIFDAQENKVLIAETETACPRFRAMRLQKNLKDEPLDD